MIFPSFMRHNQGFFTAAFICLVFALALLSCQMTPEQKKATIQTAVHVGEAAIEGTPLPWDKIGLLIGTILGAGAIVDNRRKDVVIKKDKSELNAKADLITKLANGNGTNTVK